MKTEKLSLDAFKAMANNVQEQEVMSKIEGGDLFDCHGFWGRIGKRLGLDAIFYPENYE